MSKDERKEIIEKMASNFVGLNEDDKKFLTGYMIAKQEERQKKEQIKSLISSAY